VKRYLKSIIEDESISKEDLELFIGKEEDFLKQREFDDEL